MSALLKEAWLLERYGARLTMKQLAEVLQIGVSTVHNKVSTSTLGVRTYIDGDKRRFADARDVADYLEQMRETAA